MLLRQSLYRPAWLLTHACYFYFISWVLRLQVCATILSLNHVHVLRKHPWGFFFFNSLNTVKKKKNTVVFFKVASFYNYSYSYIVRLFKDYKFGSKSLYFYFIKNILSFYVHVCACWMSFCVTCMQCSQEPMLELLNLDLQVVLRGQVRSSLNNCAISTFLKSCFLRQGLL